jgi:hypothetical protein
MAASNESLVIVLLTGGGLAELATADQVSWAARRLFDEDAREY